MSLKGLRISARRDGYRRAGIAHTRAPVDHPPGTFTAAQLAALKADPNLTVEQVETTAGKDGEAANPKASAPSTLRSGSGPAAAAEDGPRETKAARRGVR